MGALRIIGNTIWFLAGGIIAGLLWYLAGLIAAITIIGLPWARACFRIGTYTLFPFGKDVISQTELLGRGHAGKGVLRFIGNVVWFVPLGFILMVVHLISAVLCFITIIGIPFGYAHLKLAAASTFPLGKRIVPVDVARLAHAENAQTQLQTLRARS